MMERIHFADDEILKQYEGIVFENGQGLLLDQNAQEDDTHTTPSNTGLANPKEIIERTFGQEDITVEVCYVTRTYLTRHGAGPLEYECDKNEINPVMTDLTNVPNPHQGTLRYGRLNVDELKHRIEKDFGEQKDWELTVAVTHVNEYDWPMENVLKKYVRYISGGEDRGVLYSFK